MPLSSKKIRIYSPFFPDPNTGGSPQVIFDQVQTLIRLGYEVELVIWKDEPGSQNGIRGAALVQCPPVRENAKFRFKRVLGSLISPGASPEEYYYPRSAHLASLEPTDLAIYHYSFAYNWLSNPKVTLPAEKKRVVFFHNLESELFEQRAQSASIPRAWIHKLNAAKLIQHEAKLARIVDELWFLSPADRDTYLNHNPRISPQRCRLVAPTYSPEIRSIRRAHFLKDRPSESKTVLGFVGAMDFAPNHHSALWIVQELAPRLLSAGFTGEILIAGKGATPQLREKAAAYPFIRFLGFVPDLEAFWSRLSYALVPHVQGSGTRIKLLEALASGVPVLASQELGKRIAPGLSKSPLLHLSDSPQEWTNRVMGHPTFEERLAHLDAPFPQELDGAQIYRFLTSEETHV